MGISDRDNGKIFKVLSDRDFRMKKAWNIQTLFRQGIPDRKKVKKLKVFSDRKTDYPI